MNETNLKDVDLNLLVALEALLEEQNVTRAAERLGLSQPAASHALRRLRELFDDPLLVSGSGGMKPTPKAESLLSPLVRALREVEAVLVSEESFEPAATHRPFRLGCPDLLASFFTGLLSWMNAEAPRASLEVDSEYLDGMENSLETGRFDIVIGPIPERATTRLRQRRVGTTEWFCLMRRGHPALEGGFDVGSWLAYPHVVIGEEKAGVSLIELALEAVGEQRTVGLTLPDFLLGPPAVEASELIFTAPHMLAADAIERYDLVARPTPVPVPGVDTAVMWHERWDADHGHEWFRTGVWNALREQWNIMPET